MRRFLPIAFALTLVAAACGGGGTTTTTSSPTATAVTRPSVTIGSTNFYEQITLGELYTQILEANGYKVTRKFNLGNREIVQPALQSGQIDLMAEYLATLVLFLDKSAKPTGDKTATAKILQESPPPLPPRIRPGWLPSPSGCRCPAH